ncbi:hypothetical protein AKJ09_08964 [Labilithrix luteola]|uniref:Uncharacterized protein n=1 Tax=Labilithrix luteola TaxID=1391654 RepID=A0A0K1Q937_9BACT|nr:hypothetical protein AKJ09_08964 [Labilithrix luteola]
MKQPVVRGVEAQTQQRPLDEPEMLSSNGRLCVHDGAERTRCFARPPRRRRRYRPPP